MRASQYIQSHTDASSISHNHITTHTPVTLNSASPLVLHMTARPAVSKRLFKQDAHKNAHTQTERAHFLGWTTAFWAIKDENDSRAVMFNQHRKIRHNPGPLGRTSSK